GGAGKLQGALGSLARGALADRGAEADGGRVAAVSARRAVDAELEQLLAARTAAEEELTDAAGVREGAAAALYRLRSAAERVALRREAAETLAAELEAWAAAPPPRRRRHDDELVQLTRERLTALEHALA